MSGYSRFRKRVSDIIEVGYVEDFVGRAYDILNLMAIVINLTVSVMLTFDEMVAKYGDLLLMVEGVTVAFFAVDLVLRLWTAGCIYPKLSEPAALLRYVFSFNGLVDIFSCLPYYLPFFFPSGMAAFRIFRVMRIFRIFRLNAYFDSLNVIGEVIAKKSKLLISSVFIILMLMLAGSLCMYSLEHTAQPGAFDNALSGLWWACASLLTVGYGDIYPVTVAGKILGMIITMLGVGLVAIPTGIISAGFVEQYERLKIISEEEEEANLHFIRIPVDKDSELLGKKICNLKLPASIIVAAVQRGDEVMIPRGDLEFAKGDVVVFGVEGASDGLNIHVKELELKEHHKWCGLKIKELDMSRQSFIVAVQRNGRMTIPKGDLKLKAGDRLVIYTRQYVPDARKGVI